VIELSLTLRVCREEISYRILGIRPTRPLEGSSRPIIMEVSLEHCTPNQVQIGLSVVFQCVRLVQNWPLVS
jgi:hypothetical protein